MSLPFPFIFFEASGVEETMALPDAALTLLEQHYGFIAVIFWMAILLLPALFLLIVIYLHASLAMNRPFPFRLLMARSLMRLQPWMMADVFLIGVLVSMVKILSLADIGFGWSFWAFCGYVVLVLKTISDLDDDWLWTQIAGSAHAPPTLQAGRSAIAQGVTGCHACGQINAVDAHGRDRCSRCHEPLHARRRYSVQTTIALLVTAAVLYIPAMVLPIMTIVSLGDSSPQTIIGGVLILLESGDIPVALVIFCASVVVPIAKVMALAWLCWKTHRPYPWRPEVRLRLYRMTEFIGRWSMIDVFVVAVLVSLVRLGNLMSIYPGHGVIAFALVVIVTMLAAISFDPRLIWDAADNQQEESDERVNAHGSA